MNRSCLIVYSFRNTNLNFECAWPSIQKAKEKKMYERESLSSKVQFVLCSICFAILPAFQVKVQGQIKFNDVDDSHKK